MTTGYLHPEYAQALGEFGTPLQLRRSGAWYLRRSIPETPLHDGIGCYPYLACRDWTTLGEDLQTQCHDLVSFAATPDPFGDYTLADLRHAFVDHVVHFKDHCVADLTRPIDEIVSPHHLRGVRKAQRTVSVSGTTRPQERFDEWMGLFALAVDKFAIRGIRAFSPSSIAQHLALPGAYLSLAYHQGEALAAHFYLTHGDVAYAHLAAANETAHRTGAAYALYYADIEYFIGKVRWIDWGGEAGLAKDGQLSSFKQGWSTGTRPAYFCGRIFDRSRYDTITRAKGIGPSSYFPAYRQGEFQ